MCPPSLYTLVLPGGHIGLPLQNQFLTFHSSLFSPHLQQNIGQLIDNFQQAATGFVELVRCR
jgi:hypothetical protein